MVDELSLERAKAILTEVEASYNAADVERICRAYAEDIGITFGDLPTIRGRADAVAFIEARFARITDYTLVKTLRTVTGNTLGGWWEGPWTDRITGQRLAVRGSEFLTWRGDELIRWDATVTVWPLDAGPQSPIA